MSDAALAWIRRLREAEGAGETQPPAGPPDYRAERLDRLRSFLDATEPPATLGDYAAESAKGVVRGALSVPSSIAKLMGIAGQALAQQFERAAIRRQPELGSEEGAPLNIEDNLLYRAGRGAEEATRRTLPVGRGFEESLVPAIAEGVGQAGAMVLGGGVAGLAARGATARLAPSLARIAEKAAELGTASGVGATMGSYTFDEAKKAGASDDDAVRAAVLSAGLGAATEPVLGLTGLSHFDRINDATGGKLGRAVAAVFKKAARVGAEEAIEEGVQTVGENAIAKGIYDQDRELFAAMGPSMTAGGIAGAIVAAVIGGGAALRRRANQDAVPKSAAELSAALRRAAGEQPEPTLREEGAPEPEPTPETPPQARPIPVSPPASLVPADFKTPTTAAERFVNENPEQASRVAELTSVSRHKGGLGGIVGEAALRGTTAAERSKFVKAVKELFHAREVREDQGGVQEERQVGEAGQEARGDDVQQPAEGGSEAGNRQAQQEGEVAATEAVAPLPPAPSPLSLEGVAMRNVADDARRGVSALRSFARRFFTSAGELPRSAFEAKLAADAAKATIIKSATFQSNDIDTALREQYGRSVPEDVSQAVNDLLHGQAPRVQLPEIVAFKVQAARDTIDSLSRQLMQSGLLSEGLEATFDKNLGTYVHRSYRAFDDPKWAQRVPSDVRERFKAWLTSEKPDLNEAQREAYINEILYDGKAAETHAMRVLKTGRILGSKDLGILQHRKDLPVELRALLGEYTDWRVNYAKSVFKMAHLLANHQFLSNVRQAGLGTWLFEKDDPNRPPTASAVFAADHSEVLAPLNGLRTTPEIKQAFERAVEHVPLPTWMRHYMGALTRVKLAKTVGSITTHIRNIIGNPSFMLANAHWRFWNLPGAAKATFASLGLNDARQWREQYLRWMELGVVGEAARSSELRAMIEDSFGTPYEDWSIAADKSFRTVFRRVAGAATELYRAEDEVPKIYAAMNEMERYGRAYPEWSREQLERHVAGIVRDTYPHWSMIPEAVRWVRRFPITGSFVSFPAEVVRTAGKSIALALREVSDPRTRAIGLERLAGLTLAASLTGMVAALTRWWWSVSSGEDRDLRAFLPWWSKDSQIAYVGRDKDGSVRYVDLSYLDPYEYVKRPITAAWTAAADIMGGRAPDRAWEQLAIDSLMSALRPWVTEEILTSKFLDVARNTTSTGRKIYNPQDTIEQKTAAILAHIGQAFVPGTAESLARIVRGAIGETTLYGRQYEPGVEALATFTGQRIVKVDTPQALSYAVDRFTRDWDDAHGIITRTLKRAGSVSDNEIRAKYDASERAKRRLFSEMSLRMHAAVRLGMPVGSVLQTVTSGGVSREQATRLYANVYVPWRPDAEWIRRAAPRTEARARPGAGGTSELVRRVRVLLDYAAQ